MLLEELQWEGPATIEEIYAWSIGPMLMQLELFDRYCQTDYADTTSEDHILTWFYYSLRSQIERLSNTLYRLADQMDGKQKTRWREAMDLIAEMEPKERYRIKKYAEATLKKIDIPEHWNKPYDDEPKPAVPSQ